ncbi:MULTISPECIES: hypothetical protein [Photorhabdus]|nr:MULTISPECIES: hypothetical protein [Photorhabdus]
MRKSTTFGAVSILALWLLAALFLYKYNLGMPSYEGHWNKRWVNAETSAHFFNTLKRYDTRPFNEHYFAITFARACTDLVNPCVDAQIPHVPGSAQLPSPRINNEAIYTSFPPGSMIISYGVIKMASLLSGIPISWEMLQWVDMLFWIISILLIYFAISIITKASKYSTAISFLSVVPMLFALEPMHSHQVSMWAHQAFQVFAAGAFLLLAIGINRKTVIALGIVSALACWVEWTAYLMCIALFFIVLIHDIKNKSGYKSTIIYSSISIIGGLTLLLYYSFMVGLGPYFKELSIRAGARGLEITYVTWKDWWMSIYYSYGPWLISAILLLTTSLTVKKSDKFDKEDYTKVYALIAIICFMLIENVAMFEHAITYTFDRLKLGFLISFIIALSAMRMEKSGKQTLLLIAVICVVSSVFSISELLDIYPRYWK